MEHAQIAATLMIRTLIWEVETKFQHPRLPVLGPVFESKSPPTPLYKVEQLQCKKQKPISEKQPAWSSYWNMGDGSASPWSESSREP